MYKIQSVFILIFAAIVCLACENCRHVKSGRSMKLDFCKECTEVLNETITKALEDLEQFSKCLKIEFDSGFTLDRSEKNIKEAKYEMVSVLPTFIHQIKLIRNGWGKCKLPSCSQNLEKHLTRILCLSRGASKKRASCLARGRVKGPKLNSRSTIEDCICNYVQIVYSTLEGFVSNLQ